MSVSQLDGWLLLSVLAVLAVAGCGSRARPAAPPLPVPVQAGGKLGDCTEPAGAGGFAQGVFGEQPLLWRADRDLDGDGVVEVIVADRALCSGEGNCHWNLYRTEGVCYRYLGTVSAASLQRFAYRDETGFYGLRGWWKLTSERRLLLHEYRFYNGGYRLVDVLLCRQDAGDRIVCAEPGR